MLQNSMCRNFVNHSCRACRATLMSLSTMRFSSPGCWFSLKRLWPPRSFTLRLSSSGQWCYITVVMVDADERWWWWCWWWSVERGGPSPLRHWLLRTASRTDRYPAVGFAYTRLCELFLRPPPARGVPLLDAGQAIRVIAPLPSIATTALRAADRFERPAAARRKLRPENFARKLQPRAFGKQTLHTSVLSCVFSGESFYFSREVLARAGYWTISLGIWLGLELDFVETNWETMNWKGRCKTGRIR